MAVKVITGDCRDVLATLPAAHFHTVVTSPPYFGLRDYQVSSQIGLEPSPDEFMAELVKVFREVRRVLRDDGTVWLNLGDSYNSHDPGGYREGEFLNPGGRQSESSKGARNKAGTHVVGLKRKDLIGIPWRVAFALQADGWYLRQDIIWAKPNPMPESVRDRCTKAHEYIFLLSKRPRYFYDQAAIAEDSNTNDARRPYTSNGAKILDGRSDWKSGQPRDGEDFSTRNRRSVWTIATQPYSEAHFATFPPALVEPCILAGSPARCCAECGAPFERQVERFDTGRIQKMADGWDTGDGAHGTIHRSGREKGAAGIPVMASRTTGFSPSCACDVGTAPGRVLDPFGGAGTTGLVADRLQRDATLIELNPDYAEMARKRLAGDAGMFAEVV